MKQLVIHLVLYLMVFSCAHSGQRKLASRPCELGTSKDCEINYICLNSTSGAECQLAPKAAPLDNLILPFDSKTEVVCTHSSGIGSHSWSNAFYALDLATPYDRPASIVRAAASGRVYAFGDAKGNQCPLPAGGPQIAEVSDCGMSWGNRVKILHDGGYFSFYVHLEKVLVKTGDNVKQGDPIGIEGWTGAAGHRHLHWSLQRLPGLNLKDWESQIEWAGESVPFKFMAIFNGAPTVVDTSVLKCAHANIGQASPSEQPRFFGVKN